MADTSHPRWIAFICITLPRLIIGSAIFIMIALNFANVVGRYIFLSPIIWAEEVMVFMMIWCVFIGVILVTWEDRHIKMDMLSNYFKYPLREIINAFALLGFLATNAFVLIQSWGVTTMMVRLDQRSVVAEIPMAIPHSAILFGFAAMTLALVARLHFHIHGEGGTEADLVVQQMTETYGTFETPSDAVQEKKS